MAITDNTAKWDVLSVTTPQTNSGNGLLPVGHIYITMGSTAPTGSLPLTGLLYSRETYADLWNYVNTHPEQLLSESAWQTKYIENNGQVSYYSDGDGSTNFRVPTAITIDTDENDYIIENYKNGYSWCVKAFGNIEEATGSTDVTNVVNNITTLNTKVDNFVAGTLNTHATAIAKMQSYFANQMTETKLFDVLGNSAGWTGNITFSDSWKNYDFLKIEFASTYEVGGELYITDYINTKKLQEEIQKLKNAGATYYAFPITIGLGSWYWRFNFNTSTETVWIRHSNGSVYPRRVWGYKLTATGITNKSAVDVSDMSEKIGGLLTADNHLILPSGLEVW